MVKLIAKTHKGKNKLREIANKIGWGNTQQNCWVELERSNTVLFSDTKGPWLKIVPLNSSKELKYLMRWVHLNNDKDFEVIIKD